MSEHRHPFGTNEVPDKFFHAMVMLLEAYDYAIDTASERWIFAVPIHSLKPQLNEVDLLWLVRKGYVSHAKEVTSEGDNGRHFRPTGNLTFATRTCFVLTDIGVETARELVNHDHVHSMSPPDDVVAVGVSHASRPSVHWDPASRRLQVDGQLVKCFRWRAINQESILNAFQEEGWPRHIDDPLPPQPELDPKQRLSDTIKCLNRKQLNPLIRFRGDGTGEGVIWEITKESSLNRP